MRVIYDLEYWQPTFMAANVVALAEQERLRRGVQSIRVEVNAGTQDGFGRFKHWPNSREDLERGTANIILPMFEMLPSVSTVLRHKHRVEYQSDLDDFLVPRNFEIGQYAKAYAQGIRPLRPLGMPVTYDSKLVTMTLRECGDRHFAMRDSRLMDWCYAASELMDHGYRVVVLRDTRVGARGLPGLQTFAVGSDRLEERARIYASAALNLFVNNGPAWFCYMLDAPTIILRPNCETANMNARLARLLEGGWVQGKDLPGAPPHQRLIWEEDYTYIIVKHALDFLRSGVRSPTY